MQRWMTGFVVAAALLLSGCATVIRSDVTAFHAWPSELKNKEYVFERTAAQENNLEYRNYENLVRGELARLGFVEAPNRGAAKLLVSFNYRVDGRDVTVVEPEYVDPFWYQSSFYGPRWRGHYGPFYDPFWYGPPYVQYREVTYSVFKRQLKLAIKEASSGKMLYDVTVESRGNTPLVQVMPYMVRSAFAEFPGKSGVPRRVELEMQR